MSFPFHDQVPASVGSLASSAEFRVWLSGEAYADLDRLSPDTLRVCRPANFHVSFKRYAGRSGPRRRHGEQRDRTQEWSVSALRFEPANDDLLVVEDDVVVVNSVHFIAG